MTYTVYETTLLKRMGDAFQEEAQKHGFEVANLPEEPRVMYELVARRKGERGSAPHYSFTGDDILATLRKLLENGGKE